MEYTVSDLLGVGVGFVVFGLFAFAPGYTFGWFTNVFEFRRCRLATRIAAAVPISIGLSPIVAYSLWRIWLPLVWIVFGASGIACAALLASDWRSRKLGLLRSGRWVLGIAAGWLVVGALSLIDIQLGNRLYFPFSTYDHQTRAAFTAALTRDGVPPHNPFFFAGQPAPLRYHYFWLILCSLVNRLCGTVVSARVSLIAGTLWCGLGLLGVIALYLRFFGEKRSDQIERRTLIAACLLLVTGLDIVPILAWDAVGHRIVPTIEAWNEPVRAWISTLLWVPHDLAAVIAGLTGFLLVWDAAGGEKRRFRIAGVVGGGLAFATTAGTSIYIGMTFAAGCALWIAIALLKRWWRPALGTIAAGVLATLVLMPFLFQLTHGAADSAGTAHSFPVSLTVRSFTIPDLILDSFSPGKVASTWKTLALNAALLPVNYFLEFGFFFIVGTLGVRRIWREGLRNQAEWAIAALATASLLLCTFTKSTVIGPNDLGYVSALLVQFILLLWAAEMWNAGELGFGPLRSGRSAGKPGTDRWLITATLALGVMGSCYELCFQRTFPILSDMYNVEKVPWLSHDQLLGQRTFELRRAYEEMDRMLPRSAIVQAAPASGIGNIQAELYSGRPMVADLGDCGTVFGGSQEYCRNAILPRLSTLFDDRRPVTAKEVSDTCHEFSISVLLFEDDDPVWKDKSSWIWKTEPILNNGFARAIQCDAGNTLHAGSNR